MLFQEKKSLSDVGSEPRNTTKQPSTFHPGVHVSPGRRARAKRPGRGGLRFSTNKAGAVDPVGLKAAAHQEAGVETRFGPPEVRGHACRCHGGRLQHGRWNALQAKCVSDVLGSKLMLGLIRTDVFTLLAGS